MSVGVQSLALVLYSQRKGVFYIDTCKAEWIDYYYNEDILLWKKEIIMFGR